VATTALEIARKYLEARWDDDLDTAYALLDPNVEVVFPKGTMRGADQLRAAWEEAGEYDHLEPSLEGHDCEQRNGAVRTTTRVTWHWKERGEVAYRSRFSSELVVPEGKIARIETAVEHSPA
jgi:ketosteroid isomerase-like protein